MASDGPEQTGTATTGQAEPSTATGGQVAAVVTPMEVSGTAVTDPYQTEAGQDIGPDTQPPGLEGQSSAAGLPVYGDPPVPNPPVIRWETILKARAQLHDVALTLQNLDNLMVMQWTLSSQTVSARVAIWETVTTFGPVMEAVYCYPCMLLVSRSVKTCIVFRQLENNCNSLILWFGISFSLLKL